MTDPRIISTPTVAELKEQFARDYRLGAIDGGVVTDMSVGPGSDADLLGTAVVNLAMVSIAKVQVSVENSNVLTAVDEELDDIREQDGLPVVAEGSGSGKIVPVIEGPTTIVDGTQFIYPNGSRGTVVGTYLNPSDGSEIDVVATDTGKKTNLASGETVRFVSTPVNVQSEAKVSVSDPIIGGTDEESNERKRSRILNNRRNRPAGGNWGKVRQDILNQVPGVQDVYIFPALGGPSSAKIVPVREFDEENRDFSRVCSSVLLQQVRKIIWKENSSNDNLVVQANDETAATCAIQITIPDSALSGGNGLGWTDATPWPNLVGGDNGRVQVTSYSSATNTILVAGLTTVAPIGGQTNIAWWSTGDMAFYQAMALSVSGSSGAWSLVLDRPLRDKSGVSPQAGDLLSPSAKNIDGYGKQWVKMFKELGTGENTSDVARLPRAKRHPFITDEDPASISTVTASRITNEHKEITALAFSYLPTSTPAIPATADLAPALLVPSHFGVYPT